MSREIDERIVQMQFDNAQFESGVRTTLSSLDRLKQSLSFDNVSSKGMEALQNNVAAISERFSALGIIGAAALQRIANQAVDVGEKLLRSLTIQGAMDGFREYELKLGSIQTIMSGTGESLETVSAYLDELNTYADKTIYSFSDMTSSIGKFTNAGVGLEQAVKAIQGVSNEAALSGANAQQASHAMYNFAQALSSGAVKLIDWKSIETANMATKEFKEQLIQTAVEVGTLIKKGDQYVSTTKDLRGKVSDAFDAVRGFNDSLSSQWMTTEVLVQTLGRYADETTDIGKRAFAAAQDVKTFTQLIDTLKEAIGSGWAQSFEIVIGNFDEAKKLWTDVNNALGPIIDKQTQARNELLQGWKDLGGRTAVIESFANAWRGLQSVVAPVKKAFQDIFPPVTAENLAAVSERIRDMTSRFQLSKEASANLKDTFSGLFSIVDLGKQGLTAFARVASPLFGQFTNLSGGILKFTGSIGQYITQAAKSARESDLFYSALSKVADVIKMASGGLSKLKPYLPTVEDLSNFLARLREKVSPLSEVFDKAKTSVNGFFESFRRDKTTEAEQSVGIFGTLLIIFGKIISLGQKAGSFIGSLFQKAGTALSNVFTDLDFGRIVDILNGGMTLGMGLGIKKFIDSLTEITSNGAGFVNGLKDILDGITGSFEALQTRLKAKTLMTIASAIGVLTVAVIALAAVDSAKLTVSLGAMTTMFVELFGAMSVFTKLTGGTGKFNGAAATMVVMSSALLVLAGALNQLKDLSWKEIAVGLIAMGGLMAELAAFLKLADFDGLGVTKGLGLVALAQSLKIMSSAVASMGSLDLPVIIQGLGGIAAVLLEVVAFSALVDSMGSLIGIGAGMTIVAASMLIFSKAISSLGSLPVETIGTGLLTMGAALVVIGGAVKMMPATMPLIGTGLAIFASALLIVKNAVEGMGQMSWDEIAKGLVALAGALTIVTASVNLMNGALAGAAAMVAIAGALMVFTPALMLIGGMSVTEVATALITLAGAFTIIGVAGAVLTPLVPVILALGGAIALIGVGVGAAGAGLMLLAAALVSVSAGATAAAAALGAAITIILVDLIGLIPNALAAVGRGIIQIAAVIAEGAPVIGAAFTNVGLAALDALEALIPKTIKVAVEILAAFLSGVASMMPDIVLSGIAIIAGFLEGIAQGLPDIVQAGFNLIIAFINALAEAIRFNDEPLLAAMRNLASAAVEMFLSTLQALVQGIPLFGKQMSDALEEAKENVHRVLAPESFYQMGSVAAKSIGDGFSGRKGSFAKAADELAETGLNHLAAHEDEYSGRGGSFGEAFSTGLSSMVDYAGASAKDVSLSALQSMVPSSEFADAGTKDGTVFASGLSLTEGAANRAGTGIASSAAKGVSSQNAAFRTAGENAGAGFQNGLSSFMSSVRKKASALASAALNAFRGTLDEHSPSKETEKSGENFDLGAVKGMENKEGEVEEAAESVAETMTESLEPAPDWAKRVGEQFDIAYDGWIGGMVKGLRSGADILQTTAETVSSSAMSVFADSFSKFDHISDWDMTPTITPVLDLTDFHTAAHEAGGIFGPRQTIRLQGRTDLVEGISIDMAEFDADNRNIVEALRILHEDMEDLQEEMSEMQIVLDTGALVGEMAGPMDDELGRRMTWRGRGM